MTEIEEKKVEENSCDFKYVEGPIIVYKAFDKDFCCHGKQYEIGKSYHTDGDVRSLSEGFHGFIRATDAIMIYKSEVCSRFAVVELSGTVGKYSDDFYSASDMKIIEEIDLPGLMNIVSLASKYRKIKLATRDRYFFSFDYAIKENDTLPLTLSNKKIYVNGRNSWLSLTGEGCEVMLDEGSVVSSMGLSQKISSIAVEAKVMISGGFSRLESYGERANLCNMGNFNKMFVAGDSTLLLNSGNSCSLVSTGKDINISDYGFGTFIAFSGGDASLFAAGKAAHILSTGDNSHIVVTGDDAFVDCFGKNTVIAVIGKRCVVRTKDWTDVTFVGVQADFGKSCKKTKQSVTSIVHSLDPGKWYVLNDGNFEEYKG